MGMKKYKRQCRDTMLTQIAMNQAATLFAVGNVVKALGFTKEAKHLQHVSRNSDILWKDFAERFGVDFCALREEEAETDTEPDYGERLIDTEGLLSSNPCCSLWNIPGFDPGDFPDI